MQVEGSHSLDLLLDELPELPSGYFSFPVDDFFENYVEELGQRGLQNGSSETAPGTGKLLEWRLRSTVPALSIWLE